MAEDKEKPKGVEVGPKIWVESLLTEEELRENARKYPNTCRLSKSPAFFKSDYEWRYRMGKSPSIEQAKLMNDRIGYFSKISELKKLQEEEA